jgi:Ni/Co efflux regulator RcnB
MTGVKKQRPPFSAAQLLTFATNRYEDVYIIITMFLCCPLLSNPCVQRHAPLENIMKHRTPLRIPLICLLTVGAFASTALLAAPPGHNPSPAQPPSAQQQHAAPQQRAAPPQPSRAPSQPSRRTPHPPPTAHFDDHHRGIAHDYYLRTYANGRCPPGLRQRGSACAPTGARAWTRGQVLPRTVIYYDVPQPLLVELPPPPRGNRYVRVGSDILMIAIGTGLVIDAIQDIFY